MAPTARPSPQPARPAARPAAFPRTPALAAGLLAATLLATPAAGIVASPALSGAGFVQFGDLGTWFVAGSLDLTPAPDVLVFARGDYACVFTDFRNVAFSGNVVAFDSPGPCVGHGLTGNCGCLFQPYEQFTIADLGPPGSGRDRVRMSYPPGESGIALDGAVDPGDLQVR